MHHSLHLLATCILAIALSMGEVVAAEPAVQRPNVLLILNDDMGYSDLGCYGGEIDTPQLDALAAQGLRYTRFFNSARCCPSRASLLTGLHPHQADVGAMTNDQGKRGYRGDLSKEAVTIAEVLGAQGYRTYLSGKWHVTKSYDQPAGNWPTERGFDQFYGIIYGAADFFAPPHLIDGTTGLPVPQDEDYYLTDDLSDRAVAMLAAHEAQQGEAPFFMYLAYTAPHWPLHAPEVDIAAYDGRFDAGWDVLRDERYARMRKLGIIADDNALSARPENIKAWRSTRPS